MLQRGNAQEALSVTFVTDAELARLHECYLGDPSPTDVITFPAGAGFGAAGEICVSADAAARRVGSGRPFAAELALYVVHGWLHLAGHDDRNPRSKRRMRRAEARAMALLGRAGALPGFRLLG
ncbi:MAG: rRNA maturation RNase YbeY [Opitutaceae bacterium]